MNTVQGYPTTSLFLLLSDVKRQSEGNKVHLKYGYSSEGMIAKRIKIIFKALSKSKMLYKC